MKGIGINAADKEIRWVEAPAGGADGCVDVFNTCTTRKVCNVSELAAASLTSFTGADEMMYTNHVLLHRKTPLRSQSKLPRFDFMYSELPGEAAVLIQILDNGETADCTLTLENVKKLVTFSPHSF